MKTYERPMAKQVEISVGDVILTSEPTPDLGDIFGGTAQWMESFWN